jgi:group I intron endonuclease
MYHIIYKTTNTVNNKFYIGYHFQKDDPYIFDGYLGSGTLLAKAIQKYGKTAFLRETLYVYDNVADALAKEKELVDDNFLLAEDTYNVALGGGNPPSHKGIPKSDSHKKKIGESQKGKQISNEQRESISKSLTGRKREPRPDSTREKISQALTGRKRTDSEKANMSFNHADVSGENNPMFGKRGVDNPNFGRKNSSETLSLMKESALKSQKTITCPHCSATGKRSGMQRWHFDNCRLRNQKP